jgi:hypothetical protein
MSTPDYGNRPHLPEAPHVPVEQAPVVPVPEQQTVQAVGTATHPEVTVPVGSPVDVIGREHQHQLEQVHQAQPPVFPEITETPADVKVNLEDGVEAAMRHEQLGDVAVAAEAVFDRSLDHPDDPSNS